MLSESWDFQPVIVYVKCVLIMKYRNGMQDCAE